MHVVHPHSSLFQKFIRSAKLPYSLSPFSATATEIQPPTLCNRSSLLQWQISHRRRIPNPLLPSSSFSSSVAGAFYATDSQQLNSALQSLRAHGYTHFTNAVTTSDLQFELLTTAGDQRNSPASFTLFAPKDEMLYALDMATDAAVYVNTLRYHIVPRRRHAFADLQNLSSPFLDTLLPHFAILVAKIRDDDVLIEGETVSVMVDGVRVSDPDIFLGSRLAVHGIDGILLAGLNMSQDSDVLPTAESPAPIGRDRNIPVEEMFQFDRNSAPSSEGIRNPRSEIDRDNSTAEGESPPPSQFGDIPADGSFTPVNRHFNWRNAPGGLESPSDGDIPVKVNPKTMQDQLEILKSLAKKKREKHRVKGRRRHNHHQKRRVPADHVLNEL